MKKLWNRVLISARIGWCLIMSMLIFLQGNGQETLKDGGLLSTEVSVFTGTADAGDIKSLQNGSMANLICPTVVGEITANRKIQNVVTLKLIEETSYLIPSDFDVTLKVKVQYGMSLSEYVEQDLSLTYRKGEGVKYNAKQYLSFEGSPSVRVTIIGFVGAVPGFSNFDIRDILRLENEMRVTRYFALSSDPVRRQPASLNYEELPGEIKVQWSWMSGAGNNYAQLEWTWVETEMEPYYYKNGALDYDLLFSNNATRVDLPVKTGSYNIPLLYDGNGHLYYRVRAVNISLTGKVDGEWSTVQNYSYSGHDALRNWQVRTSFAEEGKRKSVIEYFDGSLRSRQTVTKDNVNNEAVIAETMYDGQGRPALQVLPTPGISSTLAYNANLNMFNTQGQNDDPADFFDLDPVPLPMVSTNGKGAANYYSSNNPLAANGINKFIPDAEGYPYTLTRYTPDATGRILSQSGVGAAFKTGSGHETKYYYGSAAQEELDGLFGTDAGTKTHYFKNMIKDANGQMSISYVDMHGRTIATALGGEAPPTLISLDYGNQDMYPNQNGALMTRNLLDLNSNIIKNNSLESINSLLVPMRKTYSFRYELNSESLQSAACEGAAPATICHDCLYDLEIAIAEESGKYDPVIKRYSNVSVSPDNDCATGVQGFKEQGSSTVANIITFPLQLEEGSYSIRKTLTVSEVSLQRYKDIWLQQRICKTEQELIDSVYNAMLLVSDCGDTATAAATTCQECQDEVGDYDTGFKPAYLSSIGYQGIVSDVLEKEIKAAFNDALENCRLLCEPGSQTAASKRLLMLADMTPGGQYAKLPASATGNSMHDKYDIFSTQNSSRPKPAYQAPLASDKTTGYYYDPNGKIDLAIHPIPIDPYFKLDATSGEEFTDLFTSSWASSLLPYHPEYDRLVYSETVLKDAYSWINSFNNTVTYENASTNGYINAPASDLLYTVPNTSSLKTTMEGWVGTNYANNLSLWQIARGDLKCQSIQDAATRDACYANAPKVPPYTDIDASEKDQLWVNFRNLYSSLREQQANSLIASERPVADQAALTAAGYSIRFMTNSQFAAQNGLNWIPGSPGGTPPNLPPVIPQDSVQQYTQSSCSAYISNWKKILEACPQLAARPDLVNTILEGMEDVCRKGTDASNPYGSSTVAPGTPDDGTPRSFEEVINLVLQANNIPLSDVCNTYIIDFPRPYGAGATLINGTAVIDECNCRLLNAYKAEAGLSNWPKVELLNAYLKSINLDTLTFEMYDAFHDACTPEPRTVPVSFTLPSFLQPCGVTCLTCGDLSELILEFKNKFPSPYNTAPQFGSSLGDTSLRRNELLANFLNFRTGNSYTWSEYLSAAAAVGCNLLTLEDNIVGSGTYPAQLIISSRAGNTPAEYVATSLIEFQPGFQSGVGDIFSARIAKNAGIGPVVICPRPRPIGDTSGLFVPPLCQRVYEMAEALATQIYQQRVETLLADFEQRYRAKCLDAKDSFTVQYTNPEYHYTLYYYDMAGSLVKTVPPKGVRPDFSDTYTNSVKNARANGGTVQPPHELVTQYRYNSLGQVINQLSPDGGESKFWYDKLGRLAVSQNAQQAQDGKFSYTRYDALGRIIEVGQKPTTAMMDQTVSQDSVALNNWIINGSAREQLTLTIYDRAYGTDVSDPETILTGRMKQRNLRNRVSFTTAKNLSTDDFHYSGTFYTYDIHGNVDTLLQDYKGYLEMRDDRFKMIAYDYDLISGKVNSVDYQPDWYLPLIGTVEFKDRYFHRYEYDAENRLTEVFSSRDKIVWEREAAYTYYRHGPLARTVLGEQQVQGVDYAYTLQGWLKGVNSTTVGNSQYDMGRDGDASGQNNMVARDVYGFGLHYYDEGNSQYDYKPVNVATNAFPRPGTAAGMQSLFNGNIAAMSVNIAALQKAGAGTNAAPLFYKYRYDQLNRLKYLETFKGLAGNAWTPVSINDHRESVLYDPNGNILSYHRKGAPEAGKATEMDQLKYYYDANTNRLNHVYDSVTNSAYTEDLEAQAADNYAYDKIGNLKKDDAEGITNITWTVYGKIASIVKGGNTISYTYDAAGNRISKRTWATNLTTIYVRDASGNVMSVYEKPATTDLEQKEAHLYGSSRLGLVTSLTAPAVDVSLGSSGVIAKLRTQTRGEKFFELSNHLGNVLAVITDKKIAYCPDPDEGVPCGTDGMGQPQLCPCSASPYVYTYKADVVSASDYAPFGMGMVGRKCQAGGYRYGFNGKENDNEVKGEGNHQDYGMRVYDPRLGRFLSVDPLTNEYPWYTPYQFAGNTPIQAIDLDGAEPLMAYARAKAAQAALQKPQATPEVIPNESSTRSLWSKTWGGVKTKYRETKERFTFSSMRKTADDVWGTAKDFGGMVIAKPGAGSSFAHRMKNLSMGASASITEPLVFFSTMTTRSAEQNAFGIGYYGFDIGVNLLTAKLSAELNRAPWSPAFSEGNQIIRNALGDGVKIIVAETIDDLAYLKRMNAKALYMDGAGSSGSILVTPEATRSHILEEAYHHKQRMQYGIDYFQSNQKMMELEAQDKLLEIGKKEGWSQSEMQELQKAKEYWNKQK